MMAATSSGMPWLLGDFNSPHVPPSWLTSQETTAVIAHTLGVSQKSLSPDHLDRPKEPKRRPKKADTDWITISEHIVRNLSTSSATWRDCEVAQSTLGAGNLRDLPLMASTRQLLSTWGFGGDASVSALGALRRERFIDVPEGAVALLDLSVALECWWPFRHNSPMHIASAEAATLEEVAEAIVREYLTMDGNRLDERWVPWILRRMSWGMPRATLDEIGAEAGVTRERVRQVIVRVSNRVGQRVWPLPHVVMNVVEALQENGFQGVQEVLLDAGFVTDDDWTPQELTELLRWLGYEAAAANLDDRFDAADEALAEQLQRDARLIKAIRKARSGMGFVRLDTVPHPDGDLIPTETVRDLLPRIYSRVYECGDWALAGDADLTTSENSVRRQLGLRNPLPSDELYSGLDREQRRRSLPKIPPPEVTFGLLESSGSLHHSDGHLYTGPALETDPGTFNGWLRSLLEEANGHVLHKEAINRAAIRDGKNLTSLGAYISFSYVVRPADRPGLYRLVGTTPSPDQLDHAQAVAEATRIPSNLSWRISDDAIDLSLSVGSNFLSMGSIPVEPALRELWPLKGARIGCFCSASFKGRVVPFGDAALSNWSTLLTHLAKDHGLVEGTTVTLQVVGDQIRVRTVN